MMDAEQRFFPYHYCPRCKRLSPTMVDSDDDRICKVCSRIIMPDESGQVVLFDKTDAELHRLPFFGDTDED